VRALCAAVALYQRLRSDAATPSLIRRAEAEAAVVRYFDQPDPAQRLIGGILRYFASPSSLVIRSGLKVPCPRRWRTCL
jgi:hypothetical protein